MAGQEFGDGWILPEPMYFNWTDLDKLLPDASSEWKQGVRNQFTTWVREWIDAHPCELKQSYRRTPRQKAEWSTFRTQKIDAYLNEPDESWRPVVTNPELRLYITDALIHGIFARVRSVVTKPPRRQQHKTKQQQMAAKRQQNTPSPAPSSVEAAVRSTAGLGLGSTACSSVYLPNQSEQLDIASLAPSRSGCTFDVTVVRVDGTPDHTLHGVFQSSSGSLETLLTDIHDRPSLFVEPEEKVVLYGVKSTEGGWVWLDCQSNLHEACQRNSRVTPEAPVRLFAFLAGPPSRDVDRKVRAALNMAYPITEPGRPDALFPITTLRQ